MPIDMNAAPTLLYAASLEAFEVGGALYFTARWIGAGLVDSLQTTDKIAAVRWLSERAFPHVDVRKVKPDESA